jgi:PQQ-dependent dehydrogenase (methanol/ethanol family)
MPVLMAVAAVCSLAIGLLIASAGTRQAPVPSPAFTAAQLTAASGDDWLGWNGNIYNQRYSALTDVNASNVKQLKIAWTRNLVIPGLKAKPGPLGVFAEQQPVVYDGIMYMPDVNGNMWSIDAGTGERIWTRRAKFPKGLTPLLPSRGVAQGDGKVYLALGDATISALDQSTGRVVWKKTIADYKDGYYFTNAPTYYRGMVITGTSGGDSGSRGFVVALNAKTGKELWRFYVIPEKKGDPGYWTWPKKKAFLGGGAMWNTPAVDPQLGLMYIVVGNPIPYSGIIRGPGQELFTDSVLALNLRTGKLRWYFQTTHHDIWDYDATNPVILYDLDGKKGIAHAGKTGWVYILDRTNGKPLIGINERKVPQLRSVNTYPTQPYPVGDAFSKQCATKKAYAGKLAPNKKPYKVGCIYTPYDDKQFVAFAPSALGGTNWPPSAYSPDTGYMYLCSKDSESPWRAIPAEKQKLKPLGDFSQIEGLFPGGGSVNVKSTGRVVAMNLRNNRIVWQVRWPSICYSGVTTTAGNLVFVGTNEGFLHAYNAKNGKLLWKSPKLKAGVNAPPVTFTANDKQYVGVFAGGNGIASIFGGTKPFYGSTFYAFAIPS